MSYVKMRMIKTYSKRAPFYNALIGRWGVAGPSADKSFDVLLPRRSLAESSIIRVLKLSKGIPDGAAEVHQRWKNDTLALCVRRHGIRRIGRNRMRAEKPKQIGGADAGGDPFDHNRSDAAIASEQKNCWDGNPVSFFGIEETQSTDHFLLRIAQNWKR